MSDIRTEETELEAEQLEEVAGGNSPKIRFIKVRGDHVIDPETNRRIYGCVLCSVKNNYAYCVEHPCPRPETVKGTLYYEHTKYDTVNKETYMSIFNVTF